MRTMLKSKSWLLVTALVALALVVSACSAGVPAPAPAPVPSPEQPPQETPVQAAEGEVVTLFVGPNRVPCTGVAPQACYQVRQSPDAEWTLFYDEIQGFEYEPGFEYELKVLKETRTNVPADASRFTWTLVEVVNKTPVAPSATFEGTTWQLIAYADSSGQLSMALPDVETTAVFDGGRVSGNAGCNNYNGTYTVDGQALTIQLGPTTMMACPEPAMAQEQAFFTNLAAAASYVLVGDQLHILNANGDVVLAFQPLVSTPLVGTTWQALSYNNGNVAWTVKDVLAHLAGAERGHQQVIHALLAGKVAGQPGFDLDTFNQADVAAREGWTLAKLLEDLNASRAATLALLDSLGANDWDRAGCHPGGFDTTVEGTFRVIAIHERRHAKDIRVALAGAE